jgi:hypothetical protein
LRPSLRPRLEPGYARLVDIVVAAIAVAAFAATVFVVARAAADVQRGRPRSVADATGEEWLTVDQVAGLLDVSPTEVIDLAERDAIPYYLIAAGSRSRPEDYRFRRAEIEAWTIG